MCVCVCPGIQMITNQKEFQGSNLVGGVYWTDRVGI